MPPRAAPEAPAWHETQVRVIPQGPRDLVMSRSAVRVRSSAPQLRPGNQAFATGGTSLAPKLESTYDNNATAAGDRRNPRGRGWITIGRGGKRPAGPQGAQIAPGRSGTSAPCPVDPRGFQAAVRADRVARRRVATGFPGGHRPTGAPVGSWESAGKLPGEHGRRKLLLHTQDRARLPPALPNSAGSSLGDLRVHRASSTWRMRFADFCPSMKMS